jgi:hypothetical protein
LDENSLYQRFHESVWHLDFFIRLANRLRYFGTTEHCIPGPFGDSYNDTSLTYAHTFAYTYSFTNLNPHGDTGVTGPKLPVHRDHYVREQGVRLGDRQSTDAYV